MDGYALKQSLKRGEGYVDVEEQAGTLIAVAEDLPSIGRSVLPIISLILVIIIFGDVPYIALTALACAILIAVVSMQSYIPDVKETFNDGIHASFSTIMVTANTNAFALMMTYAPDFQAFAANLWQLSLSPVIKLSIACVLLSFLTGSAISATKVSLEQFAHLALDAGLQAPYLHRLIVIASSSFGVMPHTGSLVTYATLSGLGHKESLKYSLPTVTGANIVGLIVFLLLS